MEDIHAPQRTTLQHFGPSIVLSLHSQDKMPTVHIHNHDQTGQMLSTVAQFIHASHRMNLIDFIDPIMSPEVLTSGQMLYF